MMFGDNGRVMGEQDRTGTIRLHGSQYERALREGLVYSFDIPLKLRGALQFRVAVRDAVSARIGAAGQFVEVPNLSNGRLALSGIVARAEEPATATQNVPPALSTGPAVRRFHQGSNIVFVYGVYNASNGGQIAPLTARVRVFRDDKI